MSIIDTPPAGQSGYGVTNVLRPGERAVPLNYQPWINSAIPAALVTSVSAWPLWKE